MPYLFYALLYTQYKFLISIFLFLYNVSIVGKVLVMMIANITLLERDPAVIITVSEISLMNSLHILKRILICFIPFNTHNNIMR